MVKVSIRSMFPSPSVSSSLPVIGWGAQGRSISGLRSERNRNHSCQAEALPDMVPIHLAPIIEI